VGVMVIYELLGHAPKPLEERTNHGACALQAVADGILARLAITQREAKAVPPTRRRVARSAKPRVGMVKAYMRDRVFPANGAQTEIKALIQDYRTWCAQKGFTPIELNAFLDEIEMLLRKLGIEIEVGDDQRVYCLGIRLAADALAATRTGSNLELRNH